MISNALAQDAAAAAMQQPGLMANLIPLVLIIVVFYFLLIRPQQKRMKEHQALVEGLRRGDKVVTAGGIIGTVTKVEDNTTVMVEIAPEVRVKVMRSTITNVMSKGEPAAANDVKDVKETKEVKAAPAASATKTATAKKPVAKKPAKK